VDLPADGRCRYVSRQWVEFTGVPAEQQLDFGWLSQISPEDRDALIAAWKTAAAAGQTSKSSSGSVTIVAITMVRHARNCVARSNGRIVKWFGMNIDTTGP